MLPFYAEFSFFVPTPLCTHSLFPFYLPSSCFALTFSKGPHMEQCWSFFVFFLLELQRSPLQQQIRFDNVCLPHSLFSDEELKKTWWPLPSIYTSLYSTVLTTLHPSRSIISILSFTLFPFLTGPLNQAWGPVPLFSHAFFLPKFWLCSSGPLRDPQPLYSSIVASRKTFISHLFLQPPQPTQHIQHTRTSFFPLSSPSFLTSEKGRKGMQMLDPPELIPNSLFLISFSCVLSLSCSLIFFPLQTPVDGAVATSQSEHTDILNHTGEAVHHNSCMLVCCLSLPLALLTCCLNLYMSIILQCVLTSCVSIWKNRNH